MNQRFAGKVVAIIACASGIGLATARRFASEGAMLALSDVRLDVLKAEAATLSIDAARFSCSAVDVRQKDQIETFIAHAVQKFGRIDVLVNNAGIAARGAVTAHSDEDWRRVMDVTLDSVFYASRAAIPHLLKTRGNIVNIASISGLAGDGGNGAYNAAKGAVVNMTRAMAIDHGRDGVRVNSVCPGLTITPLTQRMREVPAVMEVFEDRVPLARAGTADEMAAAVAFLASDDASYISGVNLAVDGGLTAWTGQPVYRARKKEGATAS